MRFVSTLLSLLLTTIALAQTAPAPTTPITAPVVSFQNIPAKFDFEKNRYLTITNTSGINVPFSQMKIKFTYGPNICSDPQANNECTLASGTQNWKVAHVDSSWELTPEASPPAPGTLTDNTFHPGSTLHIDFGVKPAGSAPIEERLLAENITAPASTELTIHFNRLDTNQTHDNIEPQFSLSGFGLDNTPMVVNADWKKNFAITLGVLDNCTNNPEIINCNYTITPYWIIIPTTHTVYHPADVTLDVNGVKKTIAPNNGVYSFHLKVKEPATLLVNYKSLSVPFKIYTAQMK